MVKLLFFCRRRPDISHEEYATRVLTDHVPLALRHHPTMRSYVVNVVEETPADLDELDSIAALSFDTLADFHERLYDSDAGRAAIEADVARFMGGAEAFVTTEHVQKRPETPPEPGRRAAGVKLVCPMRRRPGMSHEAFVEHWLERHVPLALRHHPGLSGYVTNVVDGRVDGAPAAWDGIAELHFPSAEALATDILAAGIRATGIRATGIFDSAEGQRVVTADMADFIGFTSAYRVAEYVQRAAG